MYSASNPGSNNIIWPNATGRVRAFVEDLFHQYDVDLYLCGHVHAVSRVLEAKQVPPLFTVLCFFLGAAWIAVLCVAASTSATGQFTAANT